MIGSIERIYRFAAKYPLVPVVMLVISVTVSPDPTRRATGYGGVLPMPSSPTTTAPARVDPLLAQRRRDTRAARGRVLYSPGKAPEISRAKSPRKSLCPAQRIVLGRARNASPTS